MTKNTLAKVFLGLSLTTPALMVAFTPLEIASFRSATPANHLRRSVLAL